MQRRLSQSTMTAAAVVTLAGLTASATAQQTFQRGPQQRSQYEDQGQYEQQRQQEMQRQFERQQRMMEQQQRSGRDQSFGRQFGQGLDPANLDSNTIVVLGIDLDQDGEADATYFVPGNVVRQIARQHRNEQQFGSGSMQLRPWQQLRQSSAMGQGSFDDLPLASGGQQGMGQMRSAQLRGTVTETRNARLAGQAQTSKLAKIRLQDGSTVFADLGPTRATQGVRLSRGEQIAVEGTPALLNNQPVIFADRIQTREGVVPVRRQQQGQGQMHGQGQMQRDPWQQDQQWRQQDQEWRQQDQQWRQQDQGRQQDQQWWQQDQRGQQIGMSRAERLRGTVIDTQELRIGDSDPYLFVKLESNGGKGHWVSLGPSDIAKDLDISEDDQLTVVASPLELQGETVYYAQQVQLNGRTASISQQEGGGARFQQAGMGQMQQLRGTIAEKDEVRIGDSDPYLFVKLESDGSRAKWVNLGPIDQVENLDLSEGDQITVSASEMDLHGGTVYHAHQLRANGQSVNIQQTSYR